MAASMEMSIEEQRVMSMAAEIAEASDRNVIQLLLKLKDMLENAKRGTKAAGDIKKSVVKYDMLPVIAVTLKGDFSRAKNSWEVGITIAKFMRDVATGTGTPENDDGSHESQVLPECVESILILARHLQERYVKSLDPRTTVTEMTPEMILHCFQQVIEIITSFLNLKQKLIMGFLRSPWFLQIFITDDEETALQMLELFSFCFRTVKDNLGQLDNKILYALLDEMVYDLSVCDSPRLAGATLKCLLKLCQVYGPIIDQMCVRYRGLRLLVSKWTGRGAFGRELTQLIWLLDAGSAQRAHVATSAAAAIAIQAAWRSWSERRRLRQASKSMAKFQRKWRQRQKERQANSEQEKIRKEMEHRVALRRQRRMREKLEKEVELMETLPANIVNRHIEAQKNQAATLIQAQWKGHHARKGISSKQDHARRFRAAVTIQRGIRRWLDVLDRRRKEPPAFQRPPGLTDARRKELKEQIKDWQFKRHKREFPRAEQIELHEKAQSELMRFFIRSKETRSMQQHREATMVRMAKDSELLLGAPKLSELDQPENSSEHQDCFVSRSVPIANRATQIHKTKIKRLDQPWWKQLDNEDLDEDETDYHLTRHDVFIIDGKAY